MPLAEEEETVRREDEEQRKGRGEHKNWCAWLQMHLPSGFESLRAKTLFILSSKLSCKIYVQYVLEYRSQPVPHELHQQLNS